VGIKTGFVGLGLDIERVMLSYTARAGLLTDVMRPSPPPPASRIVEKVKKRYTIGVRSMIKS
jgi:hypothetical protein